MIKSVRIKHFKAIKDSGKLTLGPLTVFVGHNGTGKSSVIEALEFFVAYACHGIDAAVTPWYDASHVWWQGTERKPVAGQSFQPLPLEIKIFGQEGKESEIGTWSAVSRFSKLTEAVGQYKAESFVPVFERFSSGKKYFRERLLGGEFVNKDNPATEPFSRKPFSIEPIFRISPYPDWRRWMFLNLDPFRIATPSPRTQALDWRMERSGAHLARYLQSFLDQDPDGFAGMVDAIRYILPYAAGLQPEVTRDLINQLSFFQLTEEFQNERPVNLPAWVLSGGTLRILAIVAALRHPTPPPVLFVEELENGLDPRAMGFLVEEIKYATQSGRTQVIATTHSPYLLDKLALDHVIIVDRKPGEPPVFSKASENEELKAWGERFAPGSLYTMGMFRGKGEQP
jgi:predicted ATPase